MWRWLVVLCSCSSPSPPRVTPTPPPPADAAIDAVSPDALIVVRDRPWTPARVVEDDAWEQCPKPIATKYKKSTKIERDYSFELACLPSGAMRVLRLRSRPKSPQSHDGGWQQLAIVDAAGEELARAERDSWGWTAGAPALKLVVDLDGDDNEDFVLEQGSTDWYQVTVLRRAGAKLEKILAVPDIAPAMGGDQKYVDEPPKCPLEITIVDEQPTNARMLVLTATPADVPEPQGCDAAKGTWRYTWRDGKLVLARSDR